MPRVLVVQHEDRVPLARLATIDGLELDVVRPDRGEPLPTTPAGHDALLVLGGTMAAWEDDVAPWLPATRRLLAAAVADGTPTLGICLGAQLLALATGGVVQRGAAGPELGVRTVRRTAAAASDPLLGALAESFRAPQGHHDAITVLPEGSVLLAGSDQYPHQAFRVGPAAWGVQYHPEVDRPTYDDWMRSDRQDLAAVGATPEQVLEDFDRQEAALADIADRHAAAFAAVVRGRRLQQSP